MTQEQLNRLCADAKELMQYDDIHEVYKFIEYLAEKYSLNIPKYRRRLNDE